MRDHIDYLDGLRGVAALLVVVSHFANRTLEHPDISSEAALALGAIGNGGGQLGVMIFFALSAFLMCHLYFGKQPTAAAVTGFARGRVARIFPLYYFVIGLSFVVDTWMPFGYLGIENYGANLVFVEGASVLWTIAPELMFYVVFVGLWLTLSGRPAVLGALALVFLLTANFLPVFGRSYTAEFFALGVLVWACRYYNIRFGLARLGILSIPLAAALVAAFLPAVQRKIGFDLTHGGWQNFGHTLFVFALFALTFECRALQRLFGCRPARFIGQISFSIYLLHLLVLSAMKHYGLLTPDLLSFGLALALIVGLSAAVFYGYESPARKALRSVSVNSVPLAVLRR